MFDMEFEDRINQKLKELNMKPAEVVRLTKNVVTKANMSQWLSGKGMPTILKCYALAKALQTTTDWLISGKLPPLITPIDLPPEYAVYKKYPLLGWGQVSDWREIMGCSKVNMEYIASPHNASEEAFVLKVAGESMQPEFMNGDMILIDPTRLPNNGDFVIAKFTYNKESTFKQLVIESDGKMLKTLNPDWPERFTPINNECEIIGTVVGKWKIY